MPEGLSSLVWRAVTDWCEMTTFSLTPTAKQALIDKVKDELEKLPEGHDVRTLRWKVRGLGKELGRSSRRLYEARCQLAEARSLNKVDPTSYRSLLDSKRELEREVEFLVAHVKKLVAERDGDPPEITLVDDIALVDEEGRC